MKEMIKLVAVTLLYASIVQANEYSLGRNELNIETFDVVVPVVASESDIPKRSGLMFYDIGAGLKIINPLGIVERITTEGTNTVSSTGGGEIIVRARIELATGEPIRLSESGSWISSISDNGDGDFTINFDSTLFGSAPVCVCTVEAANAPRFCQMNDTTTKEKARFYLTDELGAGKNIRANIICMSAR